MTLEHSNSVSAFQKAVTLIPGGVNSPVRAFGNVNDTPVFYDHARGSKVWDVDGNCYTDFICSWGPLIFGAGDETVLSAVKHQLDKGVSFGAPCMAELQLAQKIVDVVPGVEEVRMVSSGTEATMSAIRLARGLTQRNKIVKFAGNYHGHSDSLLVSAGSGVATCGIPDTPGVTAATASDTMVARYNDAASLEELFAAHGNDIACVIVEPVSGNMGVVPPEKGFLESIRALCTQYGALLIFDEVITGFRLALGGAQEYFGIEADLCTFGKIIGGGFPVGCIAGKRQFMEGFAPVGSVYQAGTLSGNPVAMVAGYAQLSKLQQAGSVFYDELARKCSFIASSLRTFCAEHELPVQVNNIGSVFTLFFSSKPVRNWDSASRCNTKQFAHYFSSMLDAGFLIAPSQFESVFISAAHTQEDCEAFVEAACRALQRVPWNE